MILTLFYYWLPAVTFLHFVKEKKSAAEFSYTATSTAPQNTKLLFSFRKCAKYIYLYISWTHCIHLHKWWSLL